MSDAGVSALVAGAITGASTVYLGSSSSWSLAAAQGWERRRVPRQATAGDGAKEEEEEEEEEEAEGSASPPTLQRPTPLLVALLLLLPFRRRSRPGQRGVGEGDGALGGGVADEQLLLPTRRRRPLSSPSSSSSSSTSLSPSPSSSPSTPSSFPLSSQGTPFAASAAAAAAVATAAATAAATAQAEEEARRRQQPPRASTPLFRRLPSSFRPRSSSSTSVGGAASGTWPCRRSPRPSFRT